MENRAILAMEANRKYVQEGLDRRRLENQLNAFEDEMFQRINENSEDAVLRNKAQKDAQLARERCKLRIAARAGAAAVAKQKRKDTVIGCLTFFAYAVVMYWLTSWTWLPIWAAAMYIAGGAMFLVLYLCRVHGLLPMEVEK